MPLRFLFGPVDPAFADRYLTGPRRAGACRAFDAVGGTDLAVGPGDTWEDVCRRLPEGWRPDLVALYLPYTSVPAGLWSAPVPLVGLAPDWSMLWHHDRRCLRRCEGILTDPAGVEALAREGIAHARPANLFGLGRDFLEFAWPEAQRDIDILFVGNFHPAVQRERLSWLGRLAGLGRRWRVELHTGVFGDDYRRLLARARIVFNRSIRGECNKRAFEAAAAGALLFSEADNREVPLYLRHGTQCVGYTTANLEDLLTYYLEHEDERRAIAEAARARVAEFSFTALWRQQLAGIERELPDLAERAHQRPTLAPAEDLLARTWQALGSSTAIDPALVPDLETAVRSGPPPAALLNALGVERTRAAQGREHVPTAEAVVCFRRALQVEPGFVVAGLNLAEALGGLGQRAGAVQAAQQALAVLNRSPDLPPGCMEAGHFPPAFDLFRVEWERAAWQHAGAPAGEARAKRALLCWRLHALLADLTGELRPFYEAAVIRPDLPPTRAALGCALGRAGHVAGALSHLRFAVTVDPFDRAAARALGCALRQAGDADGFRCLAHDRQLLAQAAPRLVPAEPWFQEVPPVQDATPSPDAIVPNAVVSVRPVGSRPRVSLCLIVRDEEQNLPDCLRSVADLVDEIVVVDTGSADRTKEIAAEFGARVFDFPWCDSFAAARNEALRHATGDWVFWLDADDRIDDENRQKLRALFAALGEDNAAYAMKCVCPPDANGGAATAVDHVRLFRNRPDVRWRYRVHEQILPAVRASGAELRWAGVVIQHTGYRDPALRRQKLDRDLRLLRLEDAERPDDPFTLFNLGMVTQDLGRPAEALALLRRSLERSDPRDSIVRKLYALVVQCHRQLGRKQDALAACQAGRGFYPDDAELLFAEGVLRRELGDPAGAEACLLRLLGGREAAHFGSIDTGVRGYKARHNLAVLYQEQKRFAEAEAQWRAAVTERDDFLPGWLGLAEVYLAQQRWPELEAAGGRVAALPEGGMEAAVLRARGHLARREFGLAREILEATIAAYPRALWPRVIRSHVLLQEGTDGEAAERALLDVLALDPNHAEALRNLAFLRQQIGRDLGAA